MKKFLSLIIVLSFTMSLFAQSKMTVANAEKGGPTRPVVANDNSKVVDVIEYITEVGAPIGFTWYDLQSNDCASDRLIQHANGTLSAVWTFAPDNTANWPQRGTGYNHFNGTSWGDAPTTRIESVRTGWPAIGSNGTTEMVIAHPATTGFYGNTSNIGAESWTSTPVAATVGYSWPRMVSSGSNYHIISVLEESTDIYQLRYFRSTDGGLTWDKSEIELPDYSTYYSDCSGDSYAIHANGDNVAIAVFSMTGNVMVWKSADNGETWTHNIIMDFPVDKYDGAGGTIIDMDDDAVADTLYASDGTGDVLIDNDGKVHVSFALTRILDEDALGNDYTYWPYTDAVLYWNSDMADGVFTEVATPSWIEPAIDAAVEVIGYSPDMDGDEVYYEYAEVADGEWPFGESIFKGLSSYPNMTVDPDGNIYLFYSSVIEGDNYVKTDATPNAQNFRHIVMKYMTASTDVWSDFYMVTSVDGTNAESLWPMCVPISTDGKIHLMFQWDGEPGINLQGDADPMVENLIIYKAIPSMFVGINEVKQLNVNIYPNPTTGLVNISNVNGAQIAVYNLIGQAVYSINSNEEVQSIDLSNLPDGAYIIKVTNGSEVVSKQVMKY